MDSQNLFILKTSFALLVSMAPLAIGNLSLASQFEACRPRTCGNGPDIRYPFWISEDQDSFCGYPNFEVVCRDEKPLLTVYDEDYIINNISYSSSSFLVVNSAVYEDTCPAPLRNVSLDRTPFSLSPKNDNFSFFYNCTDQPNFSNYSVNCGNEAGKYSYAVFQEEALDNLMNYHGVCDAFVNAHVRMDSENSFGHLMDLNYTEILKMGFVLDWTAHDCTDCDRSGGRCGFDNSQFVCFCQDGSHPKTCNDGDSADRRRKKIAIGIGCGFGGIILASAVIYFIYRYKKLSGRSGLLSRNMSSDPSSMNDSEKGSSFPGVHLFSYSELEQATNHFDSARELGDGGFGTVYYGKLRDGRSVAVKRLYENNYRRVEQFLNEVEILTRLRHRNLVQLYGCTSRHSRELLLVYEFIQNGTVADHLHGQHAKPGGLPWPVRLKIAIETASALAYLHASDIIHRDVKTHNILLDDSFIVKVADFGLSRLFPTDVTHVSTAPQGTPGYVDPEYHQCYQLTDKSDVFSFGVVLIELISSKPAVDITRHRHEINLSNMAINKIQNRALHELVDPQLGFDSDYKVRKMITAVAEMAFQCLQYEKDMRPSMMEVLEALMRIENQDYDKQKAEEMDVSVEEVVLLKNGPPPLSPDSVTVKWNSSSESTASTISS